MQERLVTPIGIFFLTTSTFHLNHFLFTFLRSIAVILMINSLGFSNALDKEVQSRTGIILRHVL
jgi:hypothetical protein